MQDLLEKNLFWLQIREWGSLPSWGKKQTNKQANKQASISFTWFKGVLDICPHLPPRTCILSTLVNLSILIVFSTTNWEWEKVMGRESCKEKHCADCSNPFPNQKVICMWLCKWRRVILLSMNVWDFMNISLLNSCVFVIFAFHSVWDMNVCDTYVCICICLKSVHKTISWACFGLYIASPFSLDVYLWKLVKWRQTYLCLKRVPTATYFLFNCYWSTCESVSDIYWFYCAEQDERLNMETLTLENS